MTGEEKISENCVTLMTSYSWGKWIGAALLSTCLLVPPVQGPDAEAARGAGAEIVGGAELIDKVECLVSVVCAGCVVVCVYWVCGGVCVLGVWWCVCTGCGGVCTGCL